MPPSPDAGPDRPAVFVSYSHKDKKWLEDLRTMLAPKVREGVVDVWWDGKIKPSQQWRQEIDAALVSARVAVLLVSPNFLASDFIVNEELSYLFDAAQQRWVKILWVLLAPCMYEQTPLQHLQALHDLARPLNSLRGAARGNALKTIAQGITDADAGTTLPNHRALSSAPFSIDLGRLPTSGPLFVGREPELARLDVAWEAPGTHVLTFVAFGGVGKSTLVARWLDRMAADGWRGARRVLDWSFYSQGTEERVTSADRFLDHALGFFGDPDPTQGAARDRGLRLAELVRRRRPCLCSTASSPFSTRRVLSPAGSRTRAWRPS